MRVRQAVLVAGDLDSVVEQLGATFGVSVCFRDPGVATFGLRNALLAVGDTFLEVVSPVRQDTTAGRYLDRRGGDGGYMVILQVDDLARRRDHLAGLGVRIVWEAAGDGIQGAHLHPVDVGGAILSLDQAEPPGSWAWAGPDWRRSVRTEVVSGIAGVELQSDAPDKLAARWSEILEAPLAWAPDGSPWIDLAPGRIRFIAATDDRGEGLSGVDLACVDRSRADTEVTIGGVRFRMVEPEQARS